MKQKKLNFLTIDPTVSRVIEAGFVEVAVHEEVNLVGRERHPGDDAVSSLVELI